MTTPLRFHFVGLAVADMAASLAFYRRLGVAIPAEADTQPHVEADLAGGVRLAWDSVDTIRSFDPNWTPPEGGAQVSLAFACAEVSEVDTWHADLVAAGYASHLDPFDAPWGQRYAVVDDPDGNHVDLFAPLP